MPKEKGGEWKHVTLVEESSGSGAAASHPKLKCVYCGKIFVGNAVRIRYHLIGSVEKCSAISQCPDAP